MVFETFIPRGGPAQEPRITILPSGVIWVNFLAKKKFFKSNRRTSLLYDKERRVIGLRPTDTPRGTYALSQSRGRNNISVSGRGFMKHFDILPDKKHAFEPRWNAENMLVEIDLNKPL